MALLLDNIKKFELEGINMQVHNHNVIFRETTSVIVADNLAQHQLGGFSEPFFYTHRFCRYCMCHQNDLQICLSNVSAEKQTILAYNSIINEID